MNIHVRVDASAFRSWAKRQFADQLPFATSLALNRTAKAVQDAIRAGLRERFAIRRPWVVQGITIPKFSDKRDRPMQVTVAIDPGRAFLGKFEAGGTKVAHSPEEPIAIPTTAIRPSLQALAPLSLYPKNLGLMARRGVTGFIAARKHMTRRGVEQLQGKQRTFVLDFSMFGIRVPGVYQRTGPGRHDIRLIWTYKPSIPIPARLKFAETAQATVARAWPAQFQAAFQQAIRTAR